MLLRIENSSQVGEARRAVSVLAQRLLFSDVDAGRVALVATEFSTNLIKHAGGGELILDSFVDADGEGIELLALDRGPGMANVSRSMEDGYSTAGSPGNGLGAAKRLSDRFAVYTRPDAGAVLMARLSRTEPAARPATPRAEIGAINVPYPGETLSGDVWTYSNRRGDTVLVADGLGHGEEAAAAAEVARTTFAAHENVDIVSLAASIHRALAPTRGAAIGIVRVDRAASLVRYVGVGNIGAAFLTNDKLRRMVNRNGTAGHLSPRISEFTYPFLDDLVLILHSDGLSARWELDAYPGLAREHASLIAGVLFRDHRRQRDDATIVVLRASA